MKLTIALTTGLLGAAFATASIAQVAGPPPIRQTPTDQQLLDATAATRVQRSAPNGLTVEYTPGPKAPGAATGVKTGAQGSGSRGIACTGANAQASAACKATPKLD